MYEPSKRMDCFKATVSNYHNNPPNILINFHRNPQYCGSVSLFKSLEKLDENFKKSLLSEAIFRVTNNCRFHVGDQDFTGVLGKANKVDPMDCELIISDDHFEIVPREWTKYSAIKHSRKLISCVEVMDDVSELIIFSIEL